MLPTLSLFPAAGIATAAYTFFTIELVYLFSLLMHAKTTMIYCPQLNLFSFSFMEPLGYRIVCTKDTEYRVQCMNAVATLSVIVNPRKLYRSVNVVPMQMGHTVQQASEGIPPAGNLELTNVQ